MNFNKPMIDLIQEIRRRVPSEAKPGVKLANPELFDELIKLYHASKDNVMRALTRELMIMAGDDWINRLDNPSTPSEKYTVHTYRGQTKLIPKASPETTPKKATKRYYRGQEVVA